ncbi:hypothetical protein BD780_003686 [Clostridium tetanomorphum]|uniref:Uncharacterized protein n=1 Tax=Clostridium tetanomorphum TaxID=1553 RepID=A0A923J135_CLOTT|nr:hypothetical protein [Clostridium tetanomorphum]KAJ50871.1 hypothetical protein CTM_15992 [Clostridium tetanomorphum DSM 665]MBC2398364.1 hypothetical protein [Clostridium tetanomorphum]MBP1865515.1 hypothetical protein [Clostridium tetanomorphum]NRS86461.1 hypothetical protein [Clostridium tetanomorphum]NRZ95510.1 hypothetical protein [Clostridium tetanomorphum]
MSLFLGKIHYWLFDKIRWFEGLEKEIVDWAEDKGDFPIHNWKNEIYGKYGEPTENKPLEDIIDTSNIHGWLQDKIARAEGRQAAWVTRIINTSEEYKNELINIFRVQGNKLGKEYGKKFTPLLPVEVFNILNDFILEGMPCDRVNEELENDENIYKWRMRVCLHTAYWEEEKGNVDNFYELREEWIKSFISALSNNFIYNVEVLNDKKICEIKK